MDKLNAVLEQVKKDAHLFDTFDGYTFDVRDLEDTYGIYAIKENMLNSYIYFKKDVPFFEELSSSQLSPFILGMMCVDIQSQQESRGE